MARRKKRRVKKDKRVPIAPTMGFALPALFSKGIGGGWESVVEAVQNKNYANAVQSAILAIFGVVVDVPGSGGWSGAPFVPVSKLVNPFDFEVAGALKGLAWGSLVSSVVGTKLGVNRNMKKIPFLGKYIKL